MRGSKNLAMELRYNPVTALKEHLFKGNRVTYLEAQMLFGIRNLYPELSRLRKDGFCIKSQTVPMARVLRRINQSALCKPPSNLPIMNLIFTEWWISE